jgi:hypothetical protein
MTRCGVCLHPLRDAIEASLAAGASQRAMGRQYGLSHHTVRRHVAGGHIVAPAPGSPAPAPVAGSAYQQMKAVTDGLAAIDYAKLSPRDQLTRLDSYAKALDKLHRMEPPSVAREGESAAEVARLRDEHQMIARVLTRFPEAREAVGAAYRERRAKAGTRL